MTLFNLRSNRFSNSKISDPYLMALVFLLSYLVTKITLKVLKHVQEQNQLTNRTYNPHDGNWGLRGIDNKQIAVIILSCIDNEKNCLVKNEKIKRLIFSLVKRNLNAQKLIQSPNLFRFLALNLLKTDESLTLIAKIRRILRIVDKKLRLFVGVGGLAALWYYGAGPPHPDYYKLPIEPTVGIVEPSKRDLILKLTHQLDQPGLYIYTSSSKTDAGDTKSKIELMKSSQYRKLQRKSQMTTFDEFKKTDPVLKCYHFPKVNLDEFKF